AVDSIAGDIRLFLVFVRDRDGVVREMDGRALDVFRGFRLPFAFSPDDHVVTGQVRGRLGVGRRTLVGEHLQGRHPQGDSGAEQARSQHTLNLLYGIPDRTTPGGGLRANPAPSGRGCAHGGRVHVDKNVELLADINGAVGGIELVDHL